MQQYDKDEIKEKLDTDKVFDIVRDFGGEPRMTDFGFISATICHNAIGEGSHKLYYYENTKLFRCYTDCASTFDIFELISKIKLLAHPNSNWGLYDSVRWVAARYGWAPTLETDEDISVLSDWKIIDRYAKIQEMKIELPQPVQLKVYDINTLKYFYYPIIDDWIKEGMTLEVLRRNLIGYYPVTEQIVIPHFDINNRLVGIRGRALGDIEAEMYGKYRPISIGKQMYNHPLGLNLYNINHSAPNIKKLKKAIIMEGEKSTLLYQSYFGYDCDISVACCGSSLSVFQVNTLLQLGVEEIIIAFDRQFQTKGDDEFKRLTKLLTAIHEKYKNYVTISFMFDLKNQLPYKASPIDCGPDIFIEMYKNRIFL